MSEADPEIGVLPRACGPYTLHGVLGAGGMAIVYRATHTLLGQEVAIKMIRPRFSQEPAVVAFFGSELQALVRIRHPHVVEVQNVFTSEHGEPCMVMELLEAPTLRDMLVKNDPILFPDLLHLAAQVAQALQTAHAAGVIHRDLKPDNISVLHRAGHDEQRLFVKVLDFGVAKLNEATGKEQVVGTLAYLAPELLRGAPADARSDAYALGVILYELAAGKLPFDPASPAELLARPETPPLSHTRPDLPVEFLELVASCTALSPEARPQSMTEISAVLDRLRSRTAAFVHTSWYVKAKQPLLPVVGWLLIVLAIVVAFYFWSERAPPPIAPVPSAAPSPSPSSDAEPERPTAKPAASPKHPSEPKPPKPPGPPKPPVQNLDEKERLDDPKAEDIPDE
ncbi:MAG: serine/threonine protein kinase [Deltaproteobacteria bacterium]|nr:serine/threonine protein kinase [Deltaproteobacteria bacterium]